MNIRKNFTLNVVAGSAFAWWTMEEASGNRVDSSLGLLAGTVTYGGGVVSQEAGFIDFCVGLSGAVDGDVAVIESNSISSADGSVTLCGWLKWSGLLVPRLTMVIIS